MGAFIYSLYSTTKRFRYGLVALFLSLISTLLLTYVRFILVELSNGKVSKELWLPFTATCNPMSDQELTLSAALTFDSLDKRFLTIRPRELRLENTRRETPENLIRSPNCTLSKGLSIDLLDSFEPSDTELLVSIRPLRIFSKGQASSVISSSIERLGWLLSAGILGLLIWEYCISLFGWTFPVAAIFSSSILLRLALLAKTPFNELSYDASAHIEYVRYIVQNLRLPPPNAGWEFFQAPLYYVLAAPVFSLAYCLGLNPTVFLQLLSLLFFVVFLIYGVKTLELFWDKRTVLFLIGCSLLFFWPSGIFHAIRISNEPLAYMTFSFGAFYLLRWYNDGQKKDFTLVIGAALVGAATKTTMMIFSFSAAVLILLKLFQTMRIRFHLAHLVRVVLPVALLTFIHLSRNFDHARSTDEKYNVIWGGATGLEGLEVATTLDKFIYFDLKTFISEPFTVAWFDFGGRQYYWNFLLKTSLFGEWYHAKSDPWHMPISLILGPIIDVLLLFMFALVIVTVLLFSSKDLSRFMPVLVLLGMSGAASLFYRIAKPFACNNDFRYIYPAMIFMTILYLSGIEKLATSDRKLALYLVYCLTSVFTLLSAVFFLTLPNFR